MINCITSTKADGNMKDAAAREKFLAANNLNGYTLTYGIQVHGTNIARITGQNAGQVFAGTDALITDDKTVLLGIFTADCVPVMISSKDTSVVAAVHAGWRGLVGGIIEQTVESFKSLFGISAKDLSVYIAPHICGNCYEIGDELKTAFNLPAETKKFSLSAEAQKRLNNIGVADILISKECTFCGKNHFSYRKGNKDERVLTVVRAGII